MAALTDKLKSVRDFIMNGFESREDDVFEDIDEDMIDDGYVDGYVDGNVVREPDYYPSKQDKSSDLKVVNHPNYKSHEVIVMEPRSFDDAAQIVQYLKEKKTILLNLHLLDKEQSQRTIDFVCGAAHALNGKPQKVDDLVFVFTPSNVTLSVDMNEVQNKFSDSLWRAPMQ